MGGGGILGALFLGSLYEYFGRAGIRELACYWPDLPDTPNMPPIAPGPA